MDAYRLEVAPGDEKMIRAVIKAVTKEARNNQLPLDGYMLAQRLIANYEDGERRLLAAQGTHTRR